MISPPETVKSPAIITSVGKPIVTLPLFPADSEIAIWLVVPFIVTVDLTPEPVPPAVNCNSAEFAPPAATGNVYVSFVLDGAVYVTFLFVESKATLAPPAAANRKSTVSVTVNCSVPPEFAIPKEVVLATVFVTVTAPVEPLTEIPVPAAILVTPVFVIVSVFGDAAAPAKLIPVLEIKLSISPSIISMPVPPFT